MGTWHDEAGRHTDRQEDLQEASSGHEDELGRTRPKRTHAIQARLPAVPGSISKRQDAPQDSASKGRRHEPVPPGEALCTEFDGACPAPSPRGVTASDAS